MTTLRAGTFFILLGASLTLLAFTFDDVQGAVNPNDNPEACNTLFGLPKGAIRMEADKKLMNPEVCDAYTFLISRYDPGPRSSIGLSNPKTEGVLKLNPDYAVALAKLMRAAPFNFRIN